MANLDDRLPGTRTPLARRLDVLTLILLVGIALFGAYSMYASFSEHIFEDAYITYRYASNVAAGEGLVFNPGERILGTSTPLYALLLGFLGWLGLDIPTTSDVIYVGSLAAVGVMGGLILRQSGGPYVALLFALIVAAGGPGMQRYIGMETAFQCALLFGVFMAVRAKRDVLGAVLVALAFLTRYDAAIFAVLYFAFLALRDRSIPWRPGLVALACVVPWLVFAQVYYGSVLPNTLNAKTGDTTFWSYLYESQRRQLKFLWHFAASNGLSIEYAPIVRWTLYTGALAGATLGARRWPMATLLWVAPVVTFCAYGVIGPHIDFAWYHSPGMLMLLLLVCLGLVELARLLRVPWLLSGMAVLLVGVSVSALPGHFRTHQDLFAQMPSYQTRVFGYQRISDLFLAAGLSDLSVLTYEPGYLCYRGKTRAIDGAGLVTKGPRWHGPIEERTSFSDLIETYEPDLLIFTGGADFPGFIDLGNGSTHFHLYMRRSHYEERFDRILAAMRELSAREPIEIEAPFHFADLGGSDAERWILRGGVAGRVGDPHQVRFPGLPPGTPSMDVRPTESGAESPTFEVDFDRVDFDFAALESAHALVELIVDESVVATVSGNFDPAVREATRGTIDLGAYRGDRARLRFMLRAPFTGPMAFNGVRSANDRSRTTLDDFGANRRADLWAEEFAEGAPQRELALAHGPALMANESIAHSYGVEGPTRQETRPFALEEDELRVAFYDFAADASFIELEVEGEIVRRVEARGWNRIRALTWDVAAWRGKSAVLRVVDGDPAPDAWVGIDEIVLATR